VGSKKGDVMGLSKSMSVDEMRVYLAAHGIKYEEAQRWCNQVRKHYPRLGQALKKSEDVRADLEIVELIYHVQQGRFPVTQQD
jgi:hypothetical protein